MPGSPGEVAGIIGWPVEHSLSPLLHNAAFAAAGLDWVYVRFPVPPGAAGRAVDGMRALGIRGLNVTMPHKRDVMAHLDEIAADAGRIGAVNTIVRSADRLVGANTDAAGFIRFLERDLGVRRPRGSAVVLGAGGAARAVAVALAAEGVEEVFVAARRPEQAEEAAAVAGATPLAWEAVRLARALAGAGILVNATPATGGGLPVEIGALPREAVVVDLIYAPPHTPLVDAARAAGLRAFNGIGMLLHQAALSFELWTDVPAPLEAMSAALVGEPGRRRPPGPAPAGGD